MKHLLISLVALTAFAAVPAAPSAAQTWQYSAQPSNQIGRQFEMGIRSKFGETPYWATFIVTGPTGRAWSRTVRVRADNWGHATFPRDFGARGRAGRYRYVIVVNGRIAISEAFRLR